MFRFSLRPKLFLLVSLAAAATCAVAIPVAQASHHKHHKKHCASGGKYKHVWVHVKKHGKYHWVHRWECVGGPLPSMGKEPAPSIFGINHGTYDTVSANYGKDEAAVKSLGGRWDHEVLSPQTATGNFASSDYWVKQARSRHLGEILSFGGIKSACSKSTSNVATCPPTTASNLSNYKSYVLRMLAHYHSVVDYYESWKEPNHASQWGGSVDPAQYAALLKAQYAAFGKWNSEHPGSGPGHSDMKLLFGSPNDFAISPGGSDMAALPFTQDVLDDLGGARAFDGAALHAYRYPPATQGPNAEDCDYVGSVPVTVGKVVRTCAGAKRDMTWSDELTAYEDLFQNHGYGVTPLWLTEFGWPGTTNQNCYPQAVGYCPSLDTQDTYLKEAYSDLLGLSFVQGALWFNIRDYAPGASSPDPKFFFNYGLLNYNYSPKSAGNDFKSLAAANPNH